MYKSYRTNFKIQLENAAKGWDKTQERCLAGGITTLKSHGASATLYDER